MKVEFAKAVPLGRMGDPERNKKKGVTSGV